MKKLLLILSLLSAMCFMLCACGPVAEEVYSDDDANKELISQENKKVSGDNIDFKIVSFDEEHHNMVKTYKAVFAKEELSARFEKVKLSRQVVISEEDMQTRYPEKVMLPEYDIETLKSFAVSFYTEKYGEFPLDAIIGMPAFTIKSFTGKLVMTFNVYFEPQYDEFGACTGYASMRRVLLTGDLYTYAVE